MLVVGRKKGESILIGDDIEIKIVKIDDGSVKIAVDAPKKISILRKELYDKIKKENKKAAISDVNVISKLKNLK